MKLLEIDWHDFVQTLERYRRLPYAARRIFVEKLTPSQAVSPMILGDSTEPLVSSGLLIAGPTGKNFRVDLPFQPFCRALRVFNRSRIFHAPSRDSFQAYVTENFEGPEIASFSGAGNQYYYYRDYAAVQSVYSRVTSADWLKSFLTAENRIWEVPYQAPGKSPYFSSAPIFEAVRHLIQALVPGAVPVPMAQLPAMIGDSHSGVAGAAIQAGLRYLFLFPCLLGEGLEPALGLWPAAARKLSAEIPSKPEPVTVAEPFHAAYLVDDMTTILASAAVSPLRVRANDSHIFEADKRVLLGVIGTLPEWVEREFRITPEPRVAVALDFLRSLEYCTQRNHADRDVRLEATASGRRWLAQPGKQRLLAVLDKLRSLNKPGSATWHFLSMPSHSEAIAPALHLAFGAIPPDSFVRLREFVAYEKESSNPYTDLRRKQPYLTVRLAGRTIDHPSADELEDAWEAALIDFLRLRLLPLGGVQIGIDGSGVICFSMTGAGRYLIGAADDFHFAAETSGRIVLQPNCEVVFLAPSARAESEFTRFCERRGKHIGTLFQVTKKSVLEAAATGLTAARVLDTLHEYCGAVLPANVEREIAGWFGQYRELRIRRALLIQCPDEDTAARLRAVAGGRVTSIANTLFEWHGEKPEAPMVKKLRDMGIFLK